MSTSLYAAKEARLTRILHLHIACHAPAILFGPYHEVPKHLKQDCQVNNGLACRRTGNLGEWCHDCRFVTVSLTEDLRPSLHNNDA